MLNNDNFNHNNNKIYNIGWKTSYLRSTGVFMVGHWCGAYIYPQFYDQIDRRFKMIPSHYTIIFVGTKRDKLLKEKCLIEIGSTGKKMCMGIYR